jgi:membrane protease YdiL (CAAX protease family)
VSDVAVEPAVAAEPRGLTVGTAALVVGGSLALLVRLRILEAPPASRIWLLGLLYGSMLAGSLLVPAVRSAARIQRSIVLAVGLGAVGAAAWAAGRPAAVPFSAWALPLAVLAAIAEEALFRRVAYGLLQPAGAAVAVVTTALLFALIHLPLYGPTALPVDLGAGLLFGWQRYASGTWTVPATTHVAANLLAVMLR